MGIEQGIPQFRHDSESVAIATHDFEPLMVNATRYCIGRQSYAVSEHAQFLEKHWHRLSEKTRWVISREVEEALAKDRAGMEQDREEWRRVARLWRAA